MYRLLFSIIVLSVVVYGLQALGYAPDEARLKQELAAVVPTLDRLAQQIPLGKKRAASLPARSGQQGLPPDTAWQAPLIPIELVSETLPERLPAPPAVDTLTDEQIIQMMGQIYRKQSDALEAEAASDFARKEALLDASVNQLRVLLMQPGIEGRPSFRELYRTVVTEYERYYGVPADTLILPYGEIFELRDAMFTALNEVEDPLLEDVTLPELHVETTVPMTMNRLVEQSIHYLIENQDRHLNRWLSRAETYFGMIEQILAEEGMPDELKYLAMIESGLNPRARSWAQAVGMWQFMAATGRDYDLTINAWVDERMDPEKSTRAAARYLRYLRDEFGDWHLALAAYNCGPGNVRKAIRRHRRRSRSAATFWNIYRYLPRETRNYVPMYVATALVASNPSAFGVGKVEAGPQYAYDEVEVNGMLGLDEIADMAGTDEATIRALNPALRRTNLPGGKQPYALRLPAGSFEPFRTAYEALPAARKHARVLQHVVRRGETLSRLAVRYGTTTHALVEENDLDGTTLRIGQRLTVPVRGASGDGTRPLLADATPRRVHYAQRSYRPIVVDEAPTAQAAASTSSTIHVVRRGDTLSEIAQRYGVSMASIRQWNRLRGNTVMVGQQLQLHPGDDAGYVTYRVRRGDSLSRIGQRYGVTVADIKRWNSLRTNTIRTGQELRIYT